VHSATPLNSISFCQSIDPSVHFLCEIRRPPFISHVTKPGDETSDSGIRMPGSTLLGRANAYIFRFQPDLKVYEQFGEILVKYRLCEKHFQARNIVDLLRTSDENASILTHIDLLSLEDWNEKHRDDIDRFRSQRWPLFPFEIKFEVMKLISKHIITIHDLILDDRLVFVLSQITLDTFIACIGKSSHKSQSDDDRARHGEIRTLKTGSQFSLIVDV